MVHVSVWPAETCHFLLPADSSRCWHFEQSTAARNRDEAQQKCFDMGGSNLLTETEQLRPAIRGQLFRSPYDVMWLIGLQNIMYDTYIWNSVAVPVGTCIKIKIFVQSLCRLGSNYGTLFGGVRTS